MPPPHDTSQSDQGDHIFQTPSTAIQNIVSLLVLLIFFLSQLLLKMKVVTISNDKMKMTNKNIKEKH